MLGEEAPDQRNAVEEEENQAHVDRYQTPDETAVVVVRTLLNMIAC